MDIQPVLSKSHVMNYVEKYAAKGKPISARYDEVLRTILQREVAENDLEKKAVRKLLVSSVGERDYSAQEVCHILIGWDLYHCSRQFVSVTVRKHEWVALRSDEKQVGGQSVLEKYKNPDMNAVFERNRVEKIMGDLSLQQVLRQFSYRQHAWHKRRETKRRLCVFSRN